MPAVKLKPSGAKAATRCPDLRLDLDIRASFENYSKHSHGAGWHAEFFHMCTWVVLNNSSRGILSHFMQKYQPRIILDNLGTKIDIMDPSKVLDTTSKEETATILEDFNQKCSSPSFNDAGKLGLDVNSYQLVWTKITGLLGLEESEKLCCVFLKTIRILSRDKVLLNKVLEDKVLDLLLHCAGIADSPPDLQAKRFHETVAVEACQALSNIIYQSSGAQHHCCSPATVALTLEALHAAHLPHALTVGYVRLLFLMTAIVPENSFRTHTLGTHDRKVAVLQHDALSVILPLLSEARGDEGLENSGLPPSPTMHREAVERVVEVLKLSYNLCVGLSNPHSSVGQGSSGSLQMSMVADSSVSAAQQQHLDLLVDRVRQLLLATAHTHQHTQIMHSHCINVLVCVPTTALASLTPPCSGSGGGTSWWGGGAAAGGQRRRPTVYKDADMSALVQILSFLHARLNADESQSSENLTPVLTMLVTVCQSSSKVRQFVRQRVLPPLRDVTHRPEEGNSLRGRLVSLMTSPVMELKHLSATLLFVLCKQSVERLIKYSGYGNCAGLLASLGLLAGGELNTEAQEQSESDDSDTEEYHRVRHMVNPVTGCYEPVRPNPMENMSEEQKEYEAIKLVNTLDKLIRTGDIKPCGVGPDGNPQPLEHVLQLQDGGFNVPGLAASAPCEQNKSDSDSD
ncbi:Guanine nucleotide exchange factor Ric8 [Trinorchestia longiramus]|nr:Guanine nucleotide exchange factor Ric8 [Trinorchestia longiramus]